MIESFVIALALIVALAAGVLAVFAWAELRALRLLVQDSRSRPLPVQKESEPADDIWPVDINRALAHYPPELAEPTRQWIKQQRRFKVGWDVIKRRVLSNEENATSNNWEIAE